MDDVDVNNGNNGNDNDNGRRRGDGGGLPPQHRGTASSYPRTVGAPHHAHARTVSALSFDVDDGDDVGGPNAATTDDVDDQADDHGHGQAQESKANGRFEVWQQGQMGSFPPPPSSSLSSRTTLYDETRVRAVQSTESAYGNSQLSLDDGSKSGSTHQAVAVEKNTSIAAAAPAPAPTSALTLPVVNEVLETGTSMSATASEESYGDTTSTPPSFPPPAEPSGTHGTATATTTTSNNNSINDNMNNVHGTAANASVKPSKLKRVVSKSGGGGGAGSSSSSTAAAGTAAVVSSSATTKQPPPVIAAAEAPPDGEGSDRIRLGICAMDKKARSKPMAEILSRLDESLFHVVFFGDQLILHQPVEEWPDVQVLIAFYSKGYPLTKAKDYVRLRRPFVLNDLDMQEKLKDRRKVYDLLEASGIDVPRHVFLSTDGYESTGTGDGNRQGQTTVEEFDDHIEINGISINKPFVEKPVDADDHNIAIYYPSSAGGGCKKLFRKIGNRSSEFYPDINEIRRDGSFIYEEFVETQGTDVKMYTVGPEYGHAEARKSPAVDGKVQRNADGKEVRFPVILTLGEKEIARRIVLQFKQFICGFDLLRVQTDRHTVVSYVCDVNGFSFVKNSRKYYDDCAQILTEHMLAAVRPERLKVFSTLDPMVKTVEDDDDSSVGFFPLRPGATLQRVARLLGQGESKSNVTTPAESDNASEENWPGNVSPPRSESSGGALQANLDPTSLLEGAVPVRQMPQELLSEPASLEASRHNSSDDLKRYATKRKSSFSGRMHQEELRCVIAIVRHGDRTPKQKLKVNMTEPLILEYFHKHCEGEKCTKELKIKAKAPLLEFVATVKNILASYDQDAKVGKPVDKKLYMQLRHMRDVLERWKITGLNRKLQIKPKSFEEDPETGEKKSVKEVQLILKWGGNLTKLGENQAIRLGRQFRQEMYPDAPGGGILRLHSTFRHDLKIKTSDEGRVMKTAAAFSKGLLELDGDLPPILVSLVHKEKGSMHMLDPSGDKDAKLELDECKEKITTNLQEDIDWREMTEEDRIRMVGPPQLTAMRDALAEVGNPRKTLMMIYTTMGSLIEQLEEMLGLMGSGDEKQIEGGEGLKGSNDEDVALSGVKLYKGETLLELTERWRFIYKRLYDPDTDKFDLSRVPDVHDNVRFDVLHNPHLGLTSTLEKLYSLAKSMADTVVPQEYGTTLAEKRSVGIKVCSSLVEKVRYDLNIARTDNKADMRYMINMDYSADLPINTMGRRIRTRLYFTSESHLHTMLNVLRFATHDGGSPTCTSPVLSPGGMQLLNDTKEICYLTQIVLRLFEDTSRNAEDPRRYRVEILFSAGATATPFHMSESTRENDLSRLDTENLRLISRDGLTCQQVENFFDSIIAASGKSEHDFDNVSISTADFLPHKKSSASVETPTSHFQSAPVTTVPIIKEDIVVGGNSTGKSSVGGESALSGEYDLDDPPVALDDNRIGGSTDNKNVIIEEGELKTGTPNEAILRKLASSESASDTVKVYNGKVVKSSSSRGIPSFIQEPVAVHPRFENENDIASAVLDISEDDSKRSVDNDLDDEPEDLELEDDLFHKYFYTFVAAGTLLLGAGCLVMAIGLSGNEGMNQRRRFTRR